MSRGDWLKVILLVIIPVNAWVGVLYYLNQQKKKVEWEYPSITTIRRSTELRVAHIAEKFGIREGKRLVYPFPIGKAETLYFGYPPHLLGKGVPCCSLTLHDLHQ